MAIKVQTDELVTVREAARRRNVSRAAIYQAIREGRLKCVQVAGGGVVLSTREVDAYTPRARTHGQKLRMEKKKQKKTDKPRIEPGSAKGMTYVMPDDFNAPIEEFSEYR